MLWDFRTYSSSWSSHPITIEINDVADVPVNISKYAFRIIAYNNSSSSITIYYFKVVKGESRIKLVTSNTTIDGDHKNLNKIVINPQEYMTINVTRPSFIYHGPSVFIGNETGRLQILIRGKSIDDTGNFTFCPSGSCPNKFEKSVQRIGYNIFPN